MKKIFIIGIGMGSQDGITVEARKVIEDCQALVGASRMLQIADSFDFSQKPVQFISYKPEEIKEWITQAEEEKIAILLSGDVGFYSGAKKLLKELEGFRVQLLPGISSVVYFCSKLQIPWEDVCLSSLHGRDCNAIQLINRNPKTFFLMSGAKGLQELCEKLNYYGMGHVILHIGQRLSYPDETIFSEQASLIRNLECDDLLVVLVENAQAKDYACISLEDDAFIRDKVPMTKQEVRTLTVGKLALTKDAIVYDIGAGSGSVSIEIALQSPEIKVYAIEKELLACQLMEKNKQKFAADNMEIINGTAPEQLEDLPVPTHVFIGGSSGNLKSILNKVYEKNPKAKVVLNTVSLNTLNEILNLANENENWELDVVQIQAAKAKQMGKYQLMMGQNPVYILSIKQK